MAASTVNIADFRCRGLNGSSLQATQRASSKPEGLRIVGYQPSTEGHGTEATENSHTEDPAVLDIAAARDRQHIQRLVLRPALISRNRSNLVRFNEPGVAVMKINQPYPMQSWDDYDHPPAA